jgi:hypothetical protein
MPEGGISGARHSVGRFRGFVASVGVLWRSGGSALFGGFGRLGVGESVGVLVIGHLFEFRSDFLRCFIRTNVLTAGSQLSIREHSGIKRLAGSQETLRKLSALFCPCVGASVRPNSQIVRVPAPAQIPKSIERVPQRARIPK